MSVPSPVLASLRSARKSYGKVLALDDMSLQLRGGQVLALLGANGAGKSTAVSVMLGLCEADHGDATLLGQPPQGDVARRDLVPGTRDADLRLGEIVVTHAHRTEHAAGGGSMDAVGDDAASGLDVWCRVRAHRGESRPALRARFAM